MTVDRLAQALDDAFAEFERLPARQRWDTAPLLIDVLRAAVARGAKLRTEALDQLRIELSTTPGKPATFRTLEGELGVSWSRLAEIARGDGWQKRKQSRRAHTETSPASR